MAAKGSAASAEMPSLQSIVDAPVSQFDLYSGLLVVSKEIAKKAYHYDISLKKYQDLMAENIAKIKSMIPSDDPEIKLNAISQYLFDIKKIEIVSFGKNPVKPEAILVPLTLDTKQGLEFTVALLYAAIAQQLDLSLWGIQKSETLYLVYEEDGRKFVVDIEDKGKVLASGIAEYEELDRAKDDNSNLSLKNMLGFFITKASALLIATKGAGEALEYLEYAEKLNPEDAETYLEEGVAYQMMGKPGEAVQAWEKALSVNPEFATVQGRLFGHYLIAKEFSKVEEIAAKLDQIDPEGNHHAMLGMNYVVQNKHDKAIEHFEIDKKHNPDKENVYKNLGLSYAENKEYDKALAVYDEAIERFPEQADFYALKASIYLKSNNIDSLISVSQESLTRDPDQPAIYAFLAIGYHEKGMMKKAKETIKETIDKYKDDWRAASIYADYLMDSKKDRKAARKYYKIALKRNSNSARIRYRLGLTYYYDKKTFQAQGEFEKGLKLFKGKQQALFHLGLALTDAYRKKFDNAIKHYKIAKEYGLENQGLEERLMRYQQTGK